MALILKTEINKVVSTVLADLVKTEFFTEWLAGFIFGYLQHKLSDYSFADDVFGYEDNFKNYRYEKGVINGTKLEN